MFLYNIRLNNATLISLTQAKSIKAMAIYDVIDMSLI